MLAILVVQPLARLRTQGRMLSLVGADLSPQGLDRIVLFVSGGVVPTLESGKAKAHPLTGDGMRQLLALNS
jgi:hypothetical protein